MFSGNHQLNPAAAAGALSIAKTTNARSAERTCHLSALSATVGLPAITAGSDYFWAKLNSNAAVSPSATVTV